jgi:16S rRNA G1207 methylase RsmC
MFFVTKTIKLHAPQNLVNSQYLYFIIQAVKILKMNTSIWMVVRYFPYGKKVSHIFLTIHNYSKKKKKKFKVFSLGLG